MPAVRRICGTDWGDLSRTPGKPLTAIMGTYDSVESVVLVKGDFVSELFYDDDADVSIIQGRKVAVIG
jgi:hypothetical protein